MGEEDRVDAVADAELGEQGVDVGLDSAGGEVELVADFGVREAAGDQGEDVEFAGE